LTTVLYPTLFFGVWSNFNKLKTPDHWLSPPYRSVQVCDSFIQTCCILKYVQTAGYQAIKHNADVFRIKIRIIKHNVYITTACFHHVTNAMVTVPE